jgi:hypothetical protein
MDEQSRIQTQIGALLDAEEAIIKNDPEDIDTYRQLASMVSDLQFQLLALSSQPVIRQLSGAQVAAMAAAQQTLANAIVAAQGATQILQAATALAKIQP